MVYSTPRTTREAGPAILALDIGTGSCKGAVFTPDGGLMAEARRPYPTHRLMGHRVEQDPNDWWHSVQAVCRELTARPGFTIAAVGLSGQVPTMVLVDGAGQALAPAISWQDRRAEGPRQSSSFHVPSRFHPPRGRVPPGCSRDCGAPLAMPIRFVRLK